MDQITTTESLLSYGRSETWRGSSSTRCRASVYGNALPGIVTSTLAAGGVQRRLHQLLACMVHGIPDMDSWTAASGAVAHPGQRPAASETLLLLLPVAGAASTELLPNRKKIDMPVALVMAATGVINGTGEELLWRGLFLELFPNDPLRGLLWPLVGFSLWHLAPQMILPSRLGRWPFLLGAALVGSASAFSAWRSGGLKNCLAPHVTTDSCGVLRLDSASAVDQLI
ncbi:MAG TPA: CPBP family intramembrane glutamic endopeptidase [Propionibacteriaceae bacterium]